jgi:acyl dehydratase
LSGPPHFEDLAVGQVERGAPAVTLTDGMAAVHRAIVGDRLALALDTTLARDVLGAPVSLAHPALVWDIAIGQSTLLTGRVIANLFYRGLVLARMPAIGDTLSTETEVVALRQTTPQAGRAASGLAVLRVRTRDQAGRAVLDFWRCAMLPLRDADGRTGHGDPFDQIPQQLDAVALREATRGWRLEPLAAARGAEREPLAGNAPGTRWTVEHGDVVSSAPELARLCLNVAGVHHDRDAQGQGRRLVYDRPRRRAGLAPAARDRDDRRLALLRAPRAGARGRHALQRARARALRAAARRRRAGPPALARCRDRRARRGRRGGRGRGRRAQGGRGSRARGGRRGWRWGG